MLRSPARTVPRLWRTWLALLDDIVAVDAGGAAGGLEQGAQHADGGGLSGAIGAQQAKDLALLDLQADPIHRGEEGGRGALEGLGEREFLFRRTVFLGLLAAGEFFHQVISFDGVGWCHKNLRGNKIPARPAWFGEHTVCRIA